MAEFEVEIEVGYNTLNWGVYKFTFPICSTADANDGLIPFGTTVVNAEVKAYSGNVKRKSDLSLFTLVPGLVDDDSSYPITVVNDNEVHITLSYPGDSYKGEKVTLIFELELTSGPKRSFYHQYIKVR